MRMESWPLNWIQLKLWRKGKTLKFGKLWHLVWTKLRLWRKGLVTLSRIDLWKRCRNLWIWSWVCLVLKRKTLWRKGVFFRKCWSWRLHIPVCLVWTWKTTNSTVDHLRLSKWLRHLTLVLRSWCVHKWWEISFFSNVFLLTRFLNVDVELNKLSSGLVLLFSNPNHRSVFRQNLVLHWHLHIFVIRQILKFFMRSHLKKRHQGFLKYTSFKTLVNRLIR